MRLSIIVPVYGTEEFLPRCADSILAGQMEDFELILVDDGSPDGAGAICDGYAARDPRVRVVHKKNEGLTAARRTGIAAAEGTYVAFVDSDDWVDPDLYETVLPKAEAAHADLAAWGFVTEFPGRSIPHTDPIPSGVYIGSDLAALRERAVYSMADRCQGMAPSTCTKLYRREAAMAHFMARKDRVSFGEDALFTYPVLFDAECVVVDRECRGYHYCQREGSITHVYRDSYFEDLQTLSRGLRKAADRICTPELERSLACNYVFLFANGIRMLLGRGNRVAFRDKFRELKTRMEDRNFRSAMEQAALSALPEDTARQMELLRQGKAAAFVLDYYSDALKGKIRAGMGK